MVSGEIILDMWQVVTEILKKCLDTTERPGAVASFSLDAVEEDLGPVNRGYPT